MKNYFFVIVGIPVIIFGSIAMANHFNQSTTTLQRIGYSLYYVNGIQATNRGLPSLLGTDENVPIPDGCWLEDVMDVERGCIQVIDYYIPDTMNLCMTPDEASNWYLELYVTGGYEPWDGYIEFYQKGDYLGTWLIYWEDPVKGNACCNDWYWTARINSSCMNKICPDSNQYPEIIGTCGYRCWVEDGTGLIPDKKIDLKIMTKWTGCTPCNNQDFTVLSVQVFMIPIILIFMFHLFSTLKIKNNGGILN